jgi:hypothetical protein
LEGKNPMKSSLALWIVLCLVFSSASLVAQSPKAAPVRMGTGVMTFDTVPGWGLRPDGTSALGPTHGAVVIDQAGNIYTSANQGICLLP